MRIGELAARSGASRRSLRYYEQQGLITAARTSSGQRLYTDAHIRLVRIIRMLLAAGLSSTTIVDLLPCMAPSPSNDTARRSAELMRRESERLRQQLSNLQNAIDALDRLIVASDTYSQPTN